ncbi:MAG: 2-hydroxyglutaryl-CoA dehydratase [Sandaracinaceae bacterium]
MGKQTIDIDAELAKFEAQQRAALGIESDAPTQHWTDAMVDPVFTKKQKAHTTMLIGGLTIAHDFIVEGALKGLGYKTRALECPDTDALRFGKEFGNRGQCNPTYFTVGNLVKELCRLRDEEGLTSQEVVDNYLFMTAGACGPCRFGMYVTEYRKALRDAGFDGFRVLLFQQTGGMKQASGEELGLVLDPSFFLTIGKALFAGDIINLLGYRIRPYELEAGATDRAVEAAKREIYQTMERKGSLLAGIWRCRQIFSEIEVDPLRVKPRVAVLGEFWAMTTEGDGNYHLQRFLEQEGSQVEIQVIANLLLYNLWEFSHDTRDRLELKGADAGQHGLEETDPGLTLAGLFFAQYALRTWWQSWAHLMGLNSHKLPDMDLVAKAGHSHYNQELRGGEGHMEVSKLILNVVHNKAHMTLSVKPFGCMPSSGVSDGVQSVITERYPEAIFCAVETSGDGAVNFYSRVQMFLFKARQRAQAEFEQALQEHGVTEEQVRDFVRGTRYAHPFFKPPHVAAGHAADIVHHVGPLIGKSAFGRAKVHAGRAYARAEKLVQKDLPYAGGKIREVAPFLPALIRRASAEAGDFLPGARAFYDKVLNTIVRPTEEEETAIRRAAEAPTPAMPRESALQVVA